MDVKKMALGVATVIAALVIYEKFVKPAIG